MVREKVYRDLMEIYASEKAEKLQAQARERDLRQDNEELARKVEKYAQDLIFANEEAKILAEESRRLKSENSLLQMRLAPYTINEEDSKVQEQWDRFWSYTGESGKLVKK